MEEESYISKRLSDSIFNFLFIANKLIYEKKVNDYGTLYGLKRALIDVPSHEFVKLKYRVEDGKSFAFSGINKDLEPLFINFVAKEQLSFHEIIYPNKHLLYIDIDGIITKRDTENVLNRRMLSAIQQTINILNKRCNLDLSFKDIRVASSMVEYSKKYSRHIIFPVVSDKAGQEEILRILQNNDKGSTDNPSEKFIDKHMVTGSSSSLRMINSAKSGDSGRRKTRTKYIICDNIKVEFAFTSCVNYLLSYKIDKYPKFHGKELFAKSKYYQLNNVDLETHEVEKALLKYFDQKFECHTTNNSSIVQVVGRNIECPIHKRIHRSNNMYVTPGNETTYSFRCHHDKKSIPFGEKKHELPKDTILHRIDQMAKVNNRENDLETILNMDRWKDFFSVLTWEKRYLLSVYENELFQYYLMNKSRRFIGIASPMGTGKTNGFIRSVLPTMQNAGLCQGKILIVSFRKTFTMSMINAFNNENRKILNYQNTRGAIDENTLEGYSGIAIQVESLPRIKMTRFSIVILDEINSICSQIGENMHLSIVLGTILNRSDKIFCMDANFNENTLMVIKGFANRESSTEPMPEFPKPTKEQMEFYIEKKKETKIEMEKYIDRIKFFNRKNLPIFVNQWQPLHKKQLAVCSSRVELYATIISLIKEKKEVKIYGTFSHKDNLEGFAKQIENLGVSVLSITSDLPEKEKVRILSDVNKTWIDYNIVLTTSSTGAGISFDEEYFDYAFVDMEPGGIDYSMMCQMAGRVRTIKKNITFLYAPIYAKGEYETNLEMHVRNRATLMAKSESIGRGSAFDAYIDPFSNIVNEIMEKIWNNPCILIPLINEVESAISLAKPLQCLVERFLQNNYIMQQCKIEISSEQSKKIRACNKSFKDFTKQEKHIQLANYGLLDETVPLPILPPSNQFDFAQWQLTKLYHLIGENDERWNDPNFVKYAFNRKSLEFFINLKNNWNNPKSVLWKILDWLGISKQDIIDEEFPEKWKTHEESIREFPEIYDFVLKLHKTLKIPNYSDYIDEENKESTNIKYQNKIRLVILKILKKNYGFSFRRNKEGIIPDYSLPFGFYDNDITLNWEQKEFRKIEKLEIEKTLPEPYVVILRNKKQIIEDEMRFDKKTIKLENRFKAIQEVYLYNDYQVRNHYRDPGVRLLLTKCDIDVVKYIFKNDEEAYRIYEIEILRTKKYKDPVKQADFESRVRISDKKIIRNMPEGRMFQDVPKVKKTFLEKIKDKEIRFRTFKEVFNCESPFQIPKFENLEKSEELSRKHGIRADCMIEAFLDADDQRFIPKKHFVRI